MIYQQFEIKESFSSNLCKKHLKILVSCPLANLIKAIQKMHSSAIKGSRLMIFNTIYYFAE